MSAWSCALLTTPELGGNEACAAMWGDPEWLVYIQKLNESGYLVEQKTSLMIPAKFCPIKR